MKPFHQLHRFGTLERDRQTPTVVIVDDDAPVREALEVIFRLSGYAVLSFGSLESFLVADKPERSCILLDLHLGSTSADEVLVHLEGRAWSRPTVILSGGLNAVVRERAYVAGARLVLDKPPNPEVLVKQVEEILAATASKPTPQL